MCYLYLCYNEFIFFLSEDKSSFLIHLNQNGNVMFCHNFMSNVLIISEKLLSNLKPNLVRLFTGLSSINFIFFVLHGNLRLVSLQKQETTQKLKKVFSIFYMWNVYFSANFDDFFLIKFSLCKFGPICWRNSEGQDDDVSVNHTMFGVRKKTYSYLLDDMIY